MSPGAWVGRDEIKRRLGGGDERLEHGRLGCWLYQRLEPRGLVERAADADWPGSDRRVLVPPWPGVLWRLTPEGERERDRLALVEMAG
jgi:hypothetical protein